MEAIPIIHNPPFYYKSQKKKSEQSEDPQNTINSQRFDSYKNSASEFLEQFEVNGLRGVNGLNGNSSQKKFPLNDIKADIYSIVQTVEFLKVRVNQGLLDLGFYLIRMNSFYKELGILQQQLNAWNYSLFEIIEGFSIGNTTKAIIKQISSAQDYTFDRISHTWHLDPKKLSASVAEITSKFITILDYLNIIDDLDYSILWDLIRELYTEMNEFNMFDPLLNELNSINCMISDMESETDSLNEHPDQKQIIDQAFFSLFESFKQFLRL